MKTRYRDNVLEVSLSKPETAGLRNSHELVQTISAMNPIRPEVTRQRLRGEGRAVGPDRPDRLRGDHAATAPGHRWGGARLTGDPSTSGSRHMGRLPGISNRQGG